MENVRKGILAAAAGIMLTTAANASYDIQVRSAYASNASASKIQPKVGDDFYVTVEYTVEGYLSVHYTARFSTPYETMTTTPVTLGAGAPGQYRITWGPFQGISARDIPITATVNPSGLTSETNRWNNTAQFNLSPTFPSQAIEYYAPQTLKAQQWMSLNASTGIKHLFMWFPQAKTEGFQTLLSSQTPSGFQSIACEYSGEPMLQRLLSRPAATHYSSSYDFTARSSSVRVNPNVLRYGSFYDLRRLPSGIDHWLQAEAYVECSDARIMQFAKDALPRDYERRYSVYEAAEQLYLATLSHCTYIEDYGNCPSALRTLMTGKGDCGYLSSLFVASCRSVGIPARTVNGFLLGSNDWHIWAEFYVPRYGWVPCDPAFAKGAMPNGGEPIYFGVIPDMNERVSVGVGFDHWYKTIRLKTLQSPAAMVYGSGGYISNFTSGCNLQVSSSHT